MHAGYRPCNYYEENFLFPCFPDSSVQISKEHKCQGVRCRYHHRVYFRRAVLQQHIILVKPQQFADNDILLELKNEGIVQPKRLRLGVAIL